MSKCPKCKNKETKWQTVDSVDIGVGFMPIAEEEICTKCGFQKTYIVEGTYIVENWKIKGKFKKNKKDDNLPF